MGIEGRLAAAMISSGVIARQNYNKPKAEDAKVPECPKQKEEAIREALAYFGMA